MLCTLSLVDKLPAGAPLPELRWGYSEVKNYLLAACQLHRDWRAPLHDTRIMTGVGRWLLLLCQALARKAIGFTGGAAGCKRDAPVCTVALQLLLFLRGSGCAA